jgi:predicted secreted protein
MKKINNYSFLILILVLSCSDSQLLTEKSLDASINGKTITVKPNQKFIVKLDIHSDGGYSWDCEINNHGVVAKDSTTYKPKNNNKNLVGGLTIETFYFRGIGTGQSNVRLIERRSWEKDVHAINTIQFAVIVQ